MMEPGYAPAEEEGSWLSCCAEAGQQQHTSALTRLRNLPSKWVPSRMPVAFHKALGGQIPSPGWTTRNDPIEKILDSHFFEYAKTPHKDAPTWSNNGMEDKEVVHWADVVPPLWEDVDSPFQRVQRTLSSPLENVDHDEFSWVLGSKYLNCMQEKRTHIADGHFDRPSDVYSTGHVTPRSPLDRLIKAFKHASRLFRSPSANTALSLAAGAAMGASVPTLPGAILGGVVSYHGARLAPYVIAKQLLLRHMNKMDVDYLRNVVTPAVQGYCDNLLKTTSPRTSTAGFLQVPVYRSGASAAGAGATDRAKMSPAPGRDASRVADESSDISDGAEDDEVELEQLTTNFLQHVEELSDEVEPKNHSADGVAAGERSDRTGGDEIEAGAVPAAWPTVSTSQGGVEDVGHAWKTRWGGAASTEKKGEVDPPGQEPEQAKDLLASPGDVIESDNEEAIDIEEN